MIECTITYRGSCRRATVPMRGEDADEVAPVRMFAADVRGWLYREITRWLAEALGYLQVQIHFASGDDKDILDHPGDAPGEVSWTMGGDARKVLLYEVLTPHQLELVRDTERRLEWR